MHFGFTPIRVVCANTESMARDSKASKLIRVRHNRFVKENVQAVRDVMNLANQEFEATADVYRFLASRSVSTTDLEKYVKVVFDANKPEDEISTRTKNILLKVTDLFESGKGNDIEGVRGTYWAAYNAVSEYLNYTKGRTSNNRIDSLWFGQNGTMNRKALDQAVALAS